MAEMKVALKGLTCANCAGKIEDTLSKLSETQEVSINLLRQEMTVKLAPNASAEEMQETVERVVHKFEPEVEVAFCRGRRQSIIMRIMSIAAAAVRRMTMMTIAVPVAVAVDMTMRMGMRMCSAENFFCALA